MNGAEIVRKIDAEVARRDKPKSRRHLGASMIGRKCPREVWYGFRWAHTTQHGGRILRLFGRGHREEPSLIQFLRDAGAEIREHDRRLWYHPESDSYLLEDWEYDPHDPDLEDASEDPFHLQRASYIIPVKQWRFQDHRGFYGGSCDGHILWPEMGITDWGLLEFKTHGEKSFIQLAGPLKEYRLWVARPDKHPFPGKGVLSAHPTHYTQMQVYMHHLGLSKALYVAVCKNTDDLYTEVVEYKPEIGAAYSDRALNTIDSVSPPARITQDPSWFVCRFCDYREICWHGKEPSKNCRTCVFGRAGDDAKWYCGKFRQDIPVDFEKIGCVEWVPWES